MSPTAEAVAAPRVLVASSSLRTAERRFYLAMTVAFAVAVFLGFARTFFLRAWYPEWAALHGAPESIFYLHGTFFAAWYVLLAVQAGLVTARRVVWHRRLGSAGAVLAAVVVVLGIIVSLVAARRPTGFVDVAMPPLQFLVVPLAAVSLFGTFVAMAVVRRRDSQAHKRYMLLASIVMLEAAVGRWPFAFIKGASPLPLLPMPCLVTDLFLLPLFVWDIRSRGRLHPATLWGSLIIVCTHALRMPLASTAAWQAFAGWAVQLP
jgi:hypothetical protein